MEKSVVEILLATYNGEKFLKEQIESILYQTYPYVRLIIRDDGSSDQTKKILSDYQKAFPEKIILLPSEKNLRVIQNFATLLQASKEKYVCFSDQDDVWMKDKIEKTLEKMQQLEKEKGSVTPILVHTDLTVVDENLSVLSSSFWKYSRIHAEENPSFSKISLRNEVTGCSLMMNRSLVNLVQKIPDSSVMHDFWIAMTASFFGYIGILKKPTLYYRQHGKNQVGAIRFSWVSFFLKGIKKLLKKETREGSFLQISQMKAFLKEFSSKLTFEQKFFLETMIQFHSFSFLKRFSLARKLKLFKTKKFYDKLLRISFVIFSKKLNRA